MFLLDVRVLNRVRLAFPDRSEARTVRIDTGALQITLAYFIPIYLT